MTALALGFGASPLPALPRRAIIVSIAAHAAALLLLPGLMGEAEKPDLPPIVATLRILPAAQPAAPAVVVPQPPREKSEPAAAPQIRQEREARPVLARPPSPHPSTPTAAMAEAPPRPAGDAPAPIEPPPAPAPALAAPAPAPVAVAAENLLLEEYGRSLSELLAHQQQYPRLAALRGWEGEVRLRLKVARKGNLVGVQVVRSSGYEVLDQNALQMVQGTPLPPPPGALGDKEIQIVVPIHYKLQRPA